jgi:hypothetical protein
MNFRLAVALGLALAASGCSNILQTVKTRAAFDFNCPEDQINVSPLGGYAYGAKGCGKVLKCNDVPYAGLLCGAPEAEPAPGGQPAADAGM